MSALSTEASLWETIAAYVTHPWVIGRAVIGLVAALVTLVVLLMLRRRRERTR